jgi:hypothetical protein
MLHSSTARSFVPSNASFVPPLCAAPSGRHKASNVTAWLIDTYGGRERPPAGHQASDQRIKRMLPNIVQALTTRNRSRRAQIKRDYDAALALPLDTPGPRELADAIEMAVTRVDAPLPAA